MSNDLDAFDQLSCCSLAHGDPAFLHQHAVEAFTVQSAQPGDKALALALALIGLHLRVDRGFDGRRVQPARRALAGRTRLATDPDSLGSRRGHRRDVLGAASGPARDQRIDAWCRADWHVWRDEHATIERLLRER